MDKTTSEKSDQRGKIILTKNAIYFANDGRAMEREDVLALRLVGLSNKDADSDNHPEDQNKNEKSDEEWLKKKGNSFG